MRAVKLRAKALDMAAELMQAPPDALDIVDGKVVRKDAPAGPSITLGEIAEHLAPTSKTLGGREPGLSAKAGSASSTRSIPTASTSRW